MSEDTLRFVYEHILPAAFALLPGRMYSPSAEAMLLAIGLQESRFRFRQQVQGPAKGFFQFEAGGGVKGVLTHPRTKLHALHVCDVLQYKPRQADCYDALVDNDVLACVFARLLLWSAPGTLPKQADVDKGWALYLEAWRPGRPHRETWDPFFTAAWLLVAGT